jgi:ribosomal protein L3 glutamine methyltransferase
MPQPRNAEELIRWAEERFAAAELFYGHGAKDALDEAVALIFEALELPLDSDHARIVAPLPDADVEAVMAMAEERIRTRRPRSYITQRCWFAGDCYYVDDRVLVPRSPIAELIEERFAPWIDAADVQRVVDLGAGSGCIGLAVAQALPWTMVDLVDDSSAALAVARMNIERLGLQQRVSIVESNLFADLNGRRYDLIVTNPPYVPEAEMNELPVEFGFEPRHALVAGCDGLDAIRAIIDQAADFLSENGWLIGEVGHGQTALEAAYPRLEFMWPEFSRGGEGVFILSATQLRDNRQ